jgi:hypothetical protein
MCIHTSLSHLCQTKCNVILQVAKAFMAQSTSGSVLFKIKAKSSRELYHYSYRPHELELLLPPMTQFILKGIYDANAYNIQFGEQV